MKNQKNKTFLRQQIFFESELFEKNNIGLIFVFGVKNRCFCYIMFNLLRMRAPRG